MIRIGCLVIIIGMATITKIWRIDVIAFMTVKTIDAGMGSCEGIIVIMDWKCSRLPTGVGCVTGLTVGWNTIGTVIRINRLVKSSFMAGETNGRGPAETIGMAFYAWGC